MEDYLVVNHLGIAWERLTAFNHQIFDMVQQLKVRLYNNNLERKIVTIYCQTLESQNQQNKIVKTKESQDKSKIIKLPILQYLHK